MSDEARVPDMFPVLSRGKHRNPRKGACFMELASYLAGERWSDHPACTHPLLAALARHVNDYTTDAGRAELVRLVPSVIGLTSEDPRMDARIALRAAITGLPVVAAERQGVLAVAVLGAERALAQLDGRPEGSLEEASERALAQAPHAARWARRFVKGLRRSPKAFRRHAAPTVVHASVQGIAWACVADSDGILRGLLAGTIDDCTPMVERTGTAAVEVRRCEAGSGDQAAVAGGVATGCRT